MPTIKDQLKKVKYKLTMILWISIALILYFKMFQYED